MEGNNINLNKQLTHRGMSDIKGIATSAETEANAIKFGIPVENSN